MRKTMYESKLAQPRQVRLSEEQERRIALLKQYYTSRAGGVRIDDVAVIRRALDLGLSALEVEFEENK